MANQSKEAEAVMPSLRLRLGLAAGYASLIAVNYIFGTGAFGVPTNQSLSGKWPSSVTPAGYAFAIWGGIFLLQGVGVILAMTPTEPNSPKAKAVCAVAPSWISMWMFENAWQLIFWNAATLSTSASVWRQLAVFGPCSAMLWGGYLSGLAGCERLKKSGATGTLAGLCYKLPTAINAGWLSAANCIGMALVAHSAFGGYKVTPLAVPLALAALAAGGGMMAVPRYEAGWLGLGYAGAVAWALQAVRFGPHVPPQVRTAAFAGLSLVGLASIAYPLVAPNSSQNKKQ